MSRRPCVHKATTSKTALLCTHLVLADPSSVGCLSAVFKVGAGYLHLLTCANSVYGQLIAIERACQARYGMCWCVRRRAIFKNAHTKRANARERTCAPSVLVCTRARARSMRPLSGAPPVAQTAPLTVHTHTNGRQTHTVDLVHSPSARSHSTHTIQS